MKSQKEAISKAVFPYAFGAGLVLALTFSCKSIIPSASGDFNEQGDFNDTVVKTLRLERTRFGFKTTAVDTILVTFYPDSTFIRLKNGQKTRLRLANKKRLRRIALKRIDTVSYQADLREGSKSTPEEPQGGPQSGEQPPGSTSIPEPQKKDSTGL